MLQWNESDSCKVLKLKWIRKILHIFLIFLHCKAFIYILWKMLLNFILNITFVRHNCIDQFKKKSTVGLQYQLCIGVNITLLSINLFLMLLKFDFPFSWRWALQGRFGQFEKGYLCFSKFERIGCWYIFSLLKSGEGGGAYSIPSTSRFG